MAGNQQRQFQGSRRVIRAAMGALRTALDFAETGHDPSRFVMQMVSPRDGGAWIRLPRTAHDPVLRQEVNRLLRALVERRESNVDVSSMRFGLKRHGSGVVVTRAGALRDLFLYRLVRLLEEVGAERLQVCQAPDRTHTDGTCGRLFLKVTRKQYCSTRCQSRTYMREQRLQEQRERQELKKGSRHGKATRTR